MNTIDDWRPASDVMNVSAIEEGVQYFSTGPDPYIISKPLEFSADAFQAIVLEMSVTKGSQLQVFWATKSTPHFNEPNSARLPIEADGKKHIYTLSLASNEKWRGGITRLRLDPTDTNAKIGMHAFKIIDRIGPRIKALGLYPNRPFARPGEPIELTAHFKNEGDMDGTVAIDRQVKTVAAGEEMEIHAGTARAETEKAYPTSVNWKGLDLNQKEIASGSLSTIVEFFDCENESDTIRLSCPTWDATIFQTQMGYGPMRFRMKGTQKDTDRAWMSRLGTLWVSGHDEEPQGIPLFAEEGKRISPSHYRFAHAIKDRSGHEWSYQLDVTKRTKPDALHLAYALQSDGGKLLHFSGPELYIGERSFGQAKDMAVFPGIEYLDRDAVSSSHAVAHPPVRDHYMPHPYKNTIPFMSLTHNGNLIALLWPPNHAWGREGTTLSPQFAVPNRLEHQDNHLFSLFVPNVPDYTLENRGIAHQPYILEPGETIDMEAVVYLGKSEDPCAVLDAWLRVYQQGDFPEPIPAPRSYEE
ncbi:hypothetical protein GF373_12550, partial [bacterium]|nr:hypothetical protein [bacterium]